MSRAIDDPRLYLVVSDMRRTITPCGGIGFVDLCLVHNRESVFSDLRHPGGKQETTPWRPELGELHWVVESSRCLITMYGFMQVIRSQTGYKLLGVAN